MINYVWTRRDLVKLALAAGMAPNLTLANDSKMITRTIPASGEQLPVIGLGTYNVFDVESTADNIDARRKVVDLLTERGGSLIDSSPMYNRAENIIGDVIAASNNRDQQSTSHGRQSRCWIRPITGHH